MGKMRRAQNTVKRDCFRRPGWSAAGGAAPLSYGEERNAFSNATARGPLAGFKRLRATAGQGPNYVGPFCGYVGLCWPHVDPCGAKRSEKWEQQKKHCKTQDILMVGRLSWGYVSPSWGYVGLS